MTSDRFSISEVLRWFPREQLVSLGSSLTVHLSFLIALGVMVLPAASAPEETPLVAQYLDTVVTTPVDTEVHTGDGVLEMSSDPVPELAGGGSEGNFLTQLAISDELSFPFAESAVPLNFNRSGFATGTLAEKVGLGTSSGRGGQGGGAGTGTGGSGGGSGKGSGFFGVRGAGDSVVFVVDASRSMYHPHPGPARTRFGRVKLELLHTISEMAPNQRFYIIFFNSATIPMPAERLMEATPAVKKRYLDWMVNVPADGGTYPEQALLLALQLRPDVIYFLTDGNFSRSVVSGTANSNRGKIPIHTIGFGDDEGETFLRAIATQSGGRYKFIPADEEALDAMAQPTDQPAKSQ